jgi:hypothetical protein
MKKTLFFRVCMGLLFSAALAAQNVATAAEDVWISAQAGGRDGKGLQTDPRDGSTPEKFDAILAHYRQAQTRDVTIHLWPGTYLTRGDAAWTLFTGWRIIGSGLANTTLKLASLSTPDTHLISGTGEGRQEVCDLTLDGNYRNLPWATGVHNISGIQLQGPGSAIRGVRVINAGGDGDAFSVIKIGGNAGNSLIEYCLVDAPATAFGNETGISLGEAGPAAPSGKPAPARDGRLLGNTVTGCQRAYTSDGMTGLVVANNLASGCGYGWYQASPAQTNVLIAHNEFLACKHGGITLGEALAQSHTSGLEIMGNTIEVDTYGTALGLFNRDIENVMVRFNRVKSVSGLGKAVSLASSVGKVALEDNVVDHRLYMDIRSTNVSWKGNRSPAGQELRGVEDHVARHASERSGFSLSPLLPAIEPQDPPQQVPPLEAALGTKGEILDWLILGPFPHPSRAFPSPGESTGGAGYTFDFMLNVEDMGKGESTVKARTGASVKVVFPSGADTSTFWTEEQLKTRRIAWQRVHAHTDRGIVNMHRVPGMGSELDNTCLYAACHLKAAAHTPVRFKIGSDDGFVLFVNGRRIGDIRDDRRTLAVDKDVFEADLQAGDNLVVVKLCNAIGSFAMVVRLTDRQDQPVQGVQVLLP